MLRFCHAQAFPPISQIVFQRAANMMPTFSKSSLLNPLPRPPKTLCLASFIALLVINWRHNYKLSPKSVHLYFSMFKQLMCTSYRLIARLLLNYKAKIDMALSMRI